jgi:biotin operon repressor
MLPEDPIMLLSVINMKLRDQYASLDDLADGLDVSAEEIKKKLEAAGFKYDSAKNQFK